MNRPNISDYNLTSDRHAEIKELIAESELQFSNRQSKQDRIYFWLSAIPVVSTMYIHLLLSLIIFFALFYLYAMLTDNGSKLIIGTFTRYRAPESYLRYESDVEKYEAWNSEQQKLEEQKLRENTRLEREKEREKKRKTHAYWMNMDPYEFEREVAELFEKHGFSTKVTKGSGDGGIDIFTTKDTKKGVIQCKRYKTKLGPAPIRDLFGVKIAGGYEDAFVVCPSGFSDNAFRFAKDNGVKLIGLKRIMEMVENHTVSFL